MTSLLFYRYLGVLVAVCGAFLTSPDGTRLLLAGLRDDLLATWRWVIVHLPWRRRGQDGVIHGVPARATVGGKPPTFTNGRLEVDPDAPVDHRVDWLYRQVVRIDGLVSGVREELHDRITQCGKSSSGTTKSQQAMLDKLRAEHDYVRDVSTNI